MSIPTIYWGNTLMRRSVEATKKKEKNVRKLLYVAS